MKILKCLHTKTTISKIKSQVTYWEKILQHVWQRANSCLYCYKVCLWVKRKTKRKNRQRTWTGHRKGNSFAFKHEKMFNLFHKKSKTTMNYNISPVRWTQVKMSGDTIRCGCIEIGGLLPSRCGYKLAQPLWQAFWQFARPNYKGTYLDPAIPFLWNYSTGLFARYTKKYR